MHESSELSTDWDFIPEDVFLFFVLLPTSFFVLSSPLSAILGLSSPSRALFPPMLYLAHLSFRDGKGWRAEN